ncbi:MAG TPA: dihydrolipoamide acetyltransferase [Gammaproteobacteria bacterium]|nr:dihydrolipoamide acetyltransferase [Gammaproteobacteria bacterium]
MGKLSNVTVPDIGGAAGVEVIEIAVALGDFIEVEDTLFTVESDKATMDIPSPLSGKLVELKISLGDKIDEGALVAVIEGAGEGSSQEDASEDNIAVNEDQQVEPEPDPLPIAESNVEPAQPDIAVSPEATVSLAEVFVPDIGGAAGVEVIEISVAPGDQILEDYSLITVESDKASMEIPSPLAGKLVELKVSLGDKLDEGSLIAVIERVESVSVASVSESEPSLPESSTLAESSQLSTESEAEKVEIVAPVAATNTGSANSSDTSDVYASPSVRRFARELGVSLGGIQGTGPRQRLTKEDVQNYVKAKMQSAASSGASDNSGLPGLMPCPKVDFSKFGEVERQALSRIRKISGAALHRNWVSIPHVTNHEDADITDLEAFRQQLNSEKPDNKVTLLALLIKACVAALKQFPEVNASLDGDDIVLKHYYHIGFAADTSKGLVVPVVRDADKKGVYELAAEIRALSAKAREGKLKPDEMQGGSFSISSLGGIGGTYFTPIINAPEVAILGVGKAREQLQKQGDEIVSRLILPLSLSWDHRALDGALSGKFNAFLADALADFRRVLL